MSGNEHLFSNGGIIRNFKPVKEPVARVGLIAPHSKEDQGSQSLGGLTEWGYNVPVILALAEHLKNIGIEVDVYIREYYEQWPDMVSGYINKKFYDLLVEPHLNCYNGRVEGSETLYWHESQKSRLAAQFVQAELVALFKSNDRGIKGLKNGDIAWRMTYTTAWPYIIPEALFVDDPDDERRLVDKQDLYDEALCMGVVKTLRAYGVTVPDYTLERIDPPPVCPTCGRAI